MRVSKILAVLAVALAVGSVLGAVSRLPSVLADSRALLVLGLIAVTMALVVGTTAFAQRWRTNPYW
ncbi:MAG: hypothetical protein ABEH65_00305 [Halobacteriales archaeon]